MKNDWFAFLSDEFKQMWLVSVIILLPFFIIGVGFGGFYHEGLEESGWSIMGAVEFGKMVVHSTAGCIVFWAFMGFIGKMFLSVWHIFS